MDAVVDPSAARLNEFAGRNGRGMAQHRDQVALAARLDAQHAESVLLIVESHPLDEAGQDLCGQAWRLSLEHGHAGNVRNCAAWTSLMCFRPSTTKAAQTIRPRYRRAPIRVFRALENRGKPAGRLNAPIAWSGLRSDRERPGLRPALPGVAS